MRKTTISILSPNVSNNSLGRCFLLKEILERHFDVEIIGPAFETGVWAPLRNKVHCKTVSLNYFPSFFREAARLIKNIRGDIIYAHKPLFTSFSLGLLKKALAGRPLILDIDDYEPPVVARFRGKRNLLFPNSYLTTVINEQLISLADEKTVAGRSLQKKYGGHVIWHARDTHRLAPEKWDRHQTRERLGLKSEQRVVAFFGTPHPYKGLDDLVTAIGLLEDPKVVFLVIGLSDCTYSSYIRQLARDYLKTEQFVDLGIQPIEELPNYLAAADLIVIPQKNTPETEIQVPAKVFDAMAMATPIIATKVSDLPEILDGCGYLAETGEPESLASTIEALLENWEAALDSGRRAHVKCTQKYSYDALERRLIPLFEKYIPVPIH